MEGLLSPAENTAAAALLQRLCRVHRLGRMPYLEAWALQRQWAEARHEDGQPDRLLFVEHPPVITLGRNARRVHLLSTPETLAAQGIEVVETDRGGDVTFHGPGQLVGYPILDLRSIRKDVVWYVRTLEEAIIRTLREIGIPSERRAGMTGVWVAEGKVAAIGVHISRWITTHGFALNVETDLNYYRHIVPCGICSHPVTSLHMLRRDVPDRPTLENRVATHFGDLLGLRIEWSAPETCERREPCLPQMF
jgi:lipoate-protein ligase B